MTKVSKKVTVGELQINTIKELMNNKGEINTKVVRITNKQVKKGIKYDTINEFYKGLLKKYEPGSIIIKAQNMDGGFSTLKAKNYFGESLYYLDEDYYSSLPREARDRLISCFDVIIRR